MIFLIVLIFRKIKAVDVGLNRRIVLLLHFCCWLPLVLFGQYNAPENSVWAFGKGTGLDFSGSSVSTLVTNQNGGGAAVSNSIEANASVADGNGDLLFYSNGTAVWDRNHNLMPGSTTGLHGQGTLQDAWTGSATQGALIVPIPDSAGKYFLFSLTGVDSPHDPNRVGKLFYSVIDMSLNNGLGDIVPGRAWIPLDNLLSEKMIGVGGNCNNVWLLVHARDTNAFRAYEITRNGLSQSPVVSYTGITGYSPFTTNNIVQNVFHSIGEMKISPDRKKLVACWGLGGNFAALYDFDPETGRVSNELQLHSGQSFYGAAFSPDNSKVYVADAQNVWQYDLLASNIANTRTVVGTITNNAASGLRLAPDGKIYIRATMPQNQLGAIQFPNLAGSACGYSANFLSVPGTGRGILTFPNEVPIPIYSKPLSTDVHYDTIICSNPNLRLKATSGYATYEWNDGVSGIQRVVNAPGTYWVQARFQCELHVDTFHIYSDTSAYSFVGNTHIVSFSCRDGGTQLNAREGYGNYKWNDGSDSVGKWVNEDGKFWVRINNFCEIITDTFFVSRTNDLTVDLGKDTIICSGTSIELTAGDDPNLRYQWQDGSTDRNFIADKPGTYSVLASVGDCIATDTIMISMASVEVDLGKDLVFCREDDWSYDLKIETTENVSFSWSTGATGPAISVTNSGKYWVDVKEAHCIMSDTIVISEEWCNCSWMFADAFTPNNDGRNDVFKPAYQPGCLFSDYQLRVFDRWGNMVFTSVQPDFGWDGNINGAPAPLGVYMYQANFATGKFKEPVNQKGSFTLIR